MKSMEFIEKQTKFFCEFCFKELTMDLRTSYFSEKQNVKFFCNHCKRAFDQNGNILIYKTVSPEGAFDKDYVSSTIQNYNNVKEKKETFYNHNGKTYKIDFEILISLGVLKEIE